MLNPDKLAVITLHTVISQLMKGEQMFGDPSEAQAGMCKFVRAVETLGTLVQAEVNLARLRQRARQNKKRYLEQKNGAVMNEDTDAVAGVDFNEHPRDLAEDVEDVDDLDADPVGDAVVFVTAKFCNSCRRLEPHYARLQRASTVDFLRVDATRDRSFAAKHGITSTPKIGRAHV